MFLLFKAYEIWSSLYVMSELKRACKPTSFIQLSVYGWKYFDFM